MRSRSAALLALAGLAAALRDRRFAVGIASLAALLAIAAAAGLGLLPLS